MTTNGRSRKGAEAPGLDQVTFGKGRGIATGDKDMIQRAHIYQRQCVLEPLGDGLIGTARLGIPAGMVVREDHCRRIEPQRLLDHLSRIHRTTVNGAPEHLGVLDQAMLRIEEQHREDFVLEASQLGAQVSRNDLT